MLRDMLCSLAILALLAVPAAADEPGAKESDIPAMPALELPSPELQAQYDKAIERLGKGSYKEARDLFRRLKSKVKATDAKEAVGRGVKEAEGGMELDKATAEFQEGKLRKAISRVDKKLKKFTGTRTGEELVKLREEALASLFLDVEDFEDDAESHDEDEEGTEEPDGEDGDGAGQGQGGGRRGDSGYGLNSRVVSGTPKDGKVRTGKGALSWRTSKELTALAFDSVKNKVGEYRYLNISIRTESSKTRPNLMIMLDTMEGNLAAGRGQGGGRRGGGRRGAAWLYQRESFQHTITPTGKWQDLRIDMKKMTVKGDVTLDMVLALRIIHLPGVSATVFIDDIRLEKE